MTETSEAGTTIGRVEMPEAADPRGGFAPVLVGGWNADWAAADAGLSTEVLGARICALATRMAQATFHWLQMIAEFDRRNGWVGVGIRSCAHWLAWTCSMGSGTAREHVRVARALDTLPLVSAEMAAGRLSYAKVREITRVAGRVDESTLVQLARTATASQLARTVAGFRAAGGSRGTQEQKRHARWTVREDGSVSFSARLPAEEGAAVIAALESARDDLIRMSGRDPDQVPCCPTVSDEAEETGTGDGTREPSTDKTAKPAPIDPADVMLQWARGYLSAAPQDRSGEDRTLVVVHVNAEHLLPDPAVPCPAPDGRSRGNAQTDTADDDQQRRQDSSTGPLDRSAIPVDCCTVAGVGGITRDTAARLACDAVVVGIIRGAGGVVLAHGRKRRLVSAAQRRLLGIRDGGCQFPSCTRTSHLEAHHVQHWAHGGRTDPDNLILLCRFHHVACHEGGVVISHALDSMPGAPRWRFTTREGDALRGDRLPAGAPGWKHDAWILWQGLDGSAGWNDPEAARIRPLWAGERFSLADAVAVLFGPERPSAQSGDRSRDDDLVGAAA